MSDATDASPRKTFELLLDRMTALAAFRHLMVIVVLLAVWLTLAPYTSLKPDDFESTGAGPINYIVFGLMAGMVVMLVPYHAALASTLTRAMIALWVWLAITSVLSTSPSLSITRLALVGFAFVLAAALPLLRGSEAAFDNCLAIAGGALLALCYFGVLFMPEVSIHSAYDVVEPHLAGSWRGTFAHKNSAAPVMAMLIFLGLHLWRSGNLIGGIAMTAGAGVFLLFSGGKTATALCLYTILAGMVLTRLTSLRALLIASLGSLAVLNLASVGSVLFPSLDSLLDVLPIDSSFTGRSEIWSFVARGDSLAADHRLRLFRVLECAGLGGPAIRNAERFHIGPFRPRTAITAISSLRSPSGFPVCCCALRCSSTSRSRIMSPRARCIRAARSRCCSCRCGSSASISRRWRRCSSIASIPAGSRFCWRCSACITSRAFLRGRRRCCAVDGPVSRRPRRQTGRGRAGRSVRCRPAAVRCFRSADDGARGGGPVARTTVSRSKNGCCAIGWMTVSSIVSVA